MDKNSKGEVFDEEYKKNMTKPRIAKPFPFNMKLEKDKDYYWCSCGLSNKQPFCDGSHVGTPFEPLKFRAKKDQSYASLCACKRNKDSAKPYCDGAHSNKMDW